MIAATMRTRTMADRKRRPHASELRRDYRSPAELREAARQLVDQAALLDELANEVEKAGAKAVYVDGVLKFRNGLELITAYVGNVEIALTIYRTRGQHGG